VAGDERPMSGCLGTFSGLSVGTTGYLTGGDATALGIGGESCVY